MASFDLIIQNGLIFDGNRSPRFRGDIGIADGIITAIGKLRASEARRVIDAHGLHVAPGFIDLHTHYDSQLFWDPYCSISGWHGVTSVVIGNCGFGFAPVEPDDRERAMLTMTRNEAVPVACMEARDAVGLGDLPRIPGERGSHAEVGERDGVDAAHPADDVDDGFRASQRR